MRALRHRRSRVRLLVRVATVRALERGGAGRGGRPGKRAPAAGGVRGVRVAQSRWRVARRAHGRAVELGSGAPSTWAGVSGVARPRTVRGAAELAGRTAPRARCEPSPAPTVRVPIPGFCRAPTHLANGVGCGRAKALSCLYSW